MDSPGHNHRHLDATTDREVVYCHACSHEWYRDEHGLTCPSCRSDVTEIISPENDPRLESTSTSSEAPALNHDHDSDPDEADIEEHVGPHGFHYRQIIRADGPDQRHPNPDVDPVLERFFGMIQDFAPPPRHTGGFFRQETERGFGDSHIHRTTFRNGNTSVTILSGAPPNLAARRDPFQSFFSNVMRDMGPPEGGEQGGPGGPPPAFARGLAEILNLFNPANAVAGDAVYSQEALDQIITNLMEAHPQSNAAPPASQEALANLMRRPVDRSLLEEESKPECAICIDDMKLGETAAFLPCKHWFHEECVVLWLKEHNTCPVCRASIEIVSPGRRGRGNASSHSNQQTPLPRMSATAESFGGRGNPFHNPQSRPAHLSRPPSQSQTRLNEVFRNISSPMPDRDREWATSTSFNYDTSRLQRRNSLSPTSPRQSVSGDYRHTRQRSPSQSNSRHETTNNEPSRSSGSGPLGWFRMFSSRGSSNQDSNQEEQ